MREGAGTGRRSYEEEEKRAKSSGIRPSSIALGPWRGGAMRAPPTGANEPQGTDAGDVRAHCTRLHCVVVPQRPPN